MEKIVRLMVHWREGADANYIRRIGVYRPANGAIEVVRQPDTAVERLFMAGFRAEFSAKTPEIAAFRYNSPNYTVATRDI